MAEDGVSCSMGRSGNVWDNAGMESFFSLLETERTATKLYRSRDQARADVFDYIQRFCKVVGRHSTLGDLSPAEFEKKAQLAQLGVLGTRSRPDTKATASACPCSPPTCSCRTLVREGGRYSWIVQRGPRAPGAQRCKHVRTRNRLDQGRRSPRARHLLPAADRAVLRRHRRREADAEGHFADRAHPRQFPR